jgi:hypothetical protein
MKTLFLCTLSLFFCLHTKAQADFIQVEHNKVLGTLSFISTASGAPGSPPSYRDFIAGNLESDSQFKELIDNFKSLDLETNMHRERYPEKRHSYTSTMDLLWISSSNATDLDDFATRTIGFLPPNDHTKLIQLLKHVEPYYEKLVWNVTSAERKQMEQALHPYKKQIGELFKKVNTFLGSEWSNTTPFKMMLYPIPLDRGGTTAIPKGNNLICSYLSGRKGEHVDLVGIAVHEMDHILYDAQPLTLQKSIDAWFTTSKSPFAPLAYDFFDEGLATAVGNGWAYEEINGTVDQGEWYNFKYVNDFGKALFPIAKDYLNTGKMIDKDFVDQAIALFETAFPKATTDLDILMNNVNIFAQVDDEALMDGYFEGITERFRMRSAYFSSPMDDKKHLERFRESNRTKLIILDAQQSKIVPMLQQEFTKFPKGLNLNKSALTSFYDLETQSSVILINLVQVEDYAPLMDALKASKYLEYGEFLGVD